MEVKEIIDGLNSIGLRLPWGTIERCARTTDVYGASCHEPYGIEIIENAIAKLEEYYKIKYKIERGELVEVPDGSVVLTKEEYERLKALPEKVHDEMDERMKEEIAIEKRMGEDKLERFENNMKNVLEIEKENIRKETAREIIEDLIGHRFAYYEKDNKYGTVRLLADYVVDDDDVKFLKEKYTKLR